MKSAKQSLGAPESGAVGAKALGRGGADGPWERSVRLGAAGGRATERSPRASAPRRGRPSAEPLGEPSPGAAN